MRNRMLQCGLVLSLLGGPCAAWTQSSVTTFGVVDTGFTRDGGSVASVSGLSNGGNTSSRLGFRGVEDLGAV